MKDSPVSPLHLVLSALVLFGVTWAVWAPAVDHDLTMDAQYFLADDDRVRNGSFAELVGTPWWDREDDGSELNRKPGLYRPVALVWMAAFHEGGELPGSRPVIQSSLNAANVTLHALASVLRFLLIFLILGGGVFAWRVAVAMGLLLALHPVAVETVGTAVGAAEGLAALFGSLALLVPFARKLLGPIGTPVIAGVCALLAMLSKENLIVLPAFALLQLWWTDENGSFKKALTASLPFFAAAVLTLVLRSMVLGGFASVGDPVLAAFPFAARLATALAVIGEYVLRVIFVPGDFNPLLSLQDVAPAEAITDPRALIGLFFVLLVVAGFLVGWERARPLGLGCAFFGLVFLPVSNLIIPIGALSATRFVYVPIFGLGLALGALLLVVVRRGGQAATIGLAVLTLALAVPLTMTARTELASFASNQALFDAGAEDWPKSAIMRQNRILSQLNDPALRMAQPAEREQMMAGLVTQIEEALALEVPVVPGTEGVVQEDLLEVRFQLAMNGAAAQNLIMQGAMQRSEREASNAARDAALDWISKAIEEAERGVELFGEQAKTNWKRFLAEAYVQRTNLLMLRQATDEAARNRLGQVLQAQLDRARGHAPDHHAIKLSELRVKTATGGSAAQFRRGLERLYEEVRTQPVTALGRNEVIKAWFDTLNAELRALIARGQAVDPKVVQERRIALAEVCLPFIADGMFREGPLGPAVNFLVEQGLNGARSQEPRVREAAREALLEAIRRGDDLDGRAKLAVRNALRALGTSR